MLGEIIVDVLERKPNKYKAAFAWRMPVGQKVDVARKKNVENTQSAVQINSSF